MIRWFGPNPRRVLAAVTKYIFRCGAQTSWQKRSYRRAVTKRRLHYGAQRWHVKWCVTAMPQALLALEPVTAEVGVPAFINSVRDQLLSGSKSAVNPSIASPAVNKIMVSWGVLFDLFITDVC